MSYHEGELAVQAQAGVLTMASRIGRGIHTVMPRVAQEFLSEQFFAVAGSVDESGQVWASALSGFPGFLSAVDDHTVHVTMPPVPGDPLWANLKSNPFIGLVVMNLAARHRVRLNGRAVSRDDGIDVAIDEAYSNCQKHIQTRILETAAREKMAVKSADQLTISQRDWIATADTFFIASAHPPTSADASHRGGSPGFVRVRDAATVEFPDYAGNAMFNTLGNLTAYPHAGLLFVDFERGATLQLTGETTIHWDAERTASSPGAERMVEFRIRKVIEIVNSIPFQFTLMAYSPVNPPAE